jgi:hypothetical protein
MDRKGEKEGTLVDLIDFPLGTITYESIGIPWWVNFKNAFIQSTQLLKKSIM